MTTGSQWPAGSRIGRNRPEQVPRVAPALRRYRPASRVRGEPCFGSSQTKTSTATRSTVSSPAGPSSISFAFKTSGSRPDDPTILAWAATNDRILLTHDKATIPGHAYDRVRAGEPMPGVFVAHGMTVGDVIDEVLLLVAASEQADWADQVVFLPLR